MPNNYGTQDCLCPFFRADEAKTIGCEGVFPNSNGAYSFRTKIEKEQIAKQYCKSWNFRNCPAYEAINKKYED